MPSLMQDPNGKPSLTARQQAFVEAFVSNGGLKDAAAVQAGYARTAVSHVRASGCRTLAVTSAHSSHPVELKLPGAGWNPAVLSMRKWLNMLAVPGHTRVMYMSRGGAA
jgi:hypothetical protein